MILDERNEFCDATSAVLGLGLDAIIGDVIDLKPATTSPNTTVDLEGSDVYFVMTVATTFVGATSTSKFELSSDSTANLATSRTIHFATAAIPVATLVAGYVICAVRLPSGSYERYLGVWETNATAAVTAGAVNAFLTRDPALYRAYADNVA